MEKYDRFTQREKLYNEMIIFVLFGLLQPLESFYVQLQYYNEKLKISRTQSL